MSQTVLALNLQLLFPSYKQLPPSFDYIPNLADLPQQHRSSRRDSSYSIDTITSDGVSSDESLSTPPSILEADPRVSPNDHVVILLASQAHARAARPPSFTRSFSLWTSKESPSLKPSQLGKERWTTTTLSGVPHDTLCNGPSVTSFRFSIPPQEQLSEAPSTGFKRKRSSHCLPLLPPHHKRFPLISSPLPGFSRCKSVASSPHP